LYIISLSGNFAHQYELIIFFDLGCLCGGGGGGAYSNNNNCNNNNNKRRYDITENVCEIIVVWVTTLLSIITL